MSLSVIPISMKAYVTATAISGDYTLYQLAFKKNTVDEEPIDGVKAIYTEEDFQIPILSTQHYYGVYFNPIDDGDNWIFKAAYGGYKYTAIVAKDDTDTLSGVTPMIFSNDEVEVRLLPQPEDGDEGKVPTVQDDLTYSLETPVSEDPRIPTPTEADNGKVLIAQDGAYVLGEVSGRSPIFATSITSIPNKVQITPIKIPTVGIKEESDVQ